MRENLDPTLMRFVNRFTIARKTLGAGREGCVDTLGATSAFVLQHLAAKLDMHDVTEVHEVEYAVCQPPEPCEAFGH